MKKDRTNIELSLGELLTPQDSPPLDYDLIMAWDAPYSFPFGCRGTATSSYRGYGQNPLVISKKLPRVRASERQSVNLNQQMIDHTQLSGAGEPI
jgi:hypothetical protein